MKITAHDRNLYRNEVTVNQMAHAIYDAIDQIGREHVCAAIRCGFALDDDGRRREQEVLKRLLFPADH